MRTAGSAPRVAPIERDQVGEGDPQGEDQGVRDAEHEHHDEGRRPGDEADDDVAEHVVADGPGDVGRDPGAAVAVALGDEALDRLAQGRALEQHEHGQGQDGDHGEDRAEHRADRPRRRRPEVRQLLADVGLVVAHEALEVEGVDELGEAGRGPGRRRGCSRGGRSRTSAPGSPRGSRRGRRARRRGRRSRGTRWSRPSPRFMRVRRCRPSTIGLSTTASRTATTNQLTSWCRRCTVRRPT